MLQEERVAEIEAVGAAKLLALTPDALTPNGDTNDDGIVNVQDLLELLNQWGQCSGDCSADFNGDQMVDVTDLLTMLANWG